MKRCPECGRNYNDDSMSFCLDDGSELLFGPASIGEPATAILHETAPPAEAATRAQIDLTNQTDVLPAGAADAGTTRKLDMRLLALPMLLVVVLFAGYAGYRYFSSANSKQIESIAVMPFVNESGAADVEYLSDGMTETLISSLSNLSNLNVKPRSSVFRYKGKDTDPQTIGKELNVQAILNGRLGQRGQDVSLYVELIDISLDKVVWSQTYNRKQSDLVSLQSDIARDVSGKLKTQLSGADEAKLTKTYATNPEAYQLYLKGNYYRSKYTDEGYKKAIDYYHQAIEIDPNFAVAYAGIANSYLSVAEVYFPMNEGMPKAKTAVLKALELDNSLAEAHALSGAISIWYEWDWSAGERELKRAIELDPNNAESHHQYGWYFAMTGKLDQAIVEAELAHRLAPLDINISGDLEGFYQFSGRNDDALQQSQKTIEIDPTSGIGYNGLGMAYAGKRQFPEAIAAMEKAHSLDNSPWLSGFRGYVYASAGKKTEAQKILDELKELSNHQYVPAYNVSFIYAGLNDKDKAFELLNKGFETHSGLSPIKVETSLSSLRDDPRYKDLLKRMNLPE
ncbi:MAG: tetratricopeptide repeat protein [Acidobacteriota bacterium]